MCTASRQKAPYLNRTDRASLYQLASVTNPAMTTYRQDTAALGKTAAAKLIELIEKPRTALVDRILIPGKLVEGGSVRAI